jgi:hypothetical protein
LRRRQVGARFCGLSKQRSDAAADHLFDAAIRGRTDEVVGVSESIIMGTECPLGTGLFKLRMQSNGPFDCPRRPPLLIR